MKFTKWMVEEIHWKATGSLFLWTLVIVETYVHINIYIQTHLDEQVAMEDQDQEEEV